MHKKAYDFKYFESKHIINDKFGKIYFEVGNYSQRTSVYRNSKRNDHWTAFVRLKSDLNKLRLETEIKLIIKSIEFSDNPFFNAPSKINYCTLDKNKNDYARAPHEISYSSKTWFPDYIFIRITFVKSLEIEPMVICRKLHLN